MSHQVVLSASFLIIFHGLKGKAPAWGLKPNDGPISQRETCVSGIETHEWCLPGHLELRKPSFQTADDTHNSIL